MATKDTAPLDIVPPAGSANQASNAPTTVTYKKKRSSGLSNFLIFLAALLFCVGLPLQWIQVNIVDQEGFSNLVSSVASNETVQNSVSGSVNKSVDSQIQSALQGIPFIPDSVGSDVSSSLQEGISEGVSSPGFNKAVSQSLEQTHRNNMSKIQNYSSGSDSGGLSLDLKPVTTYLTDSGIEGLKQNSTLGQVASGIDINSLTGQTPESVEVGDSGTVEVLHYVVLASNYALVILIAAGILAVIGFVVAPRKGAALRNVGLWALVCAGIWYILTLVVQTWMSNQSGDEQGGAVIDAISGVVLKSFTEWIIITAIAGAVIFIVGLVASFFEKKNA